MTASIFICYAHEDKAFLDGLSIHLKSLQRERRIDIWHSYEINAGAEREREIEKHFDTANIFLLLVSPNFIASDYCYSKEMKRAMERHEHGEARVIPIILRPTSWHDTPLGKLQELPKDGLTLTSRKWRNRDTALFFIVEEIKKVIDEIYPITSLISSGYPEEPLQNPIIDFKNTPTTLLESLSRKRLCPVCIEEFYPGECRIVSSMTGEELKAAPKGWLEKHFARIHPEPLFHPNYLHRGAYRECPNCGYLLPHNFEHTENLSIVIIGDVGSGKSHYLASVIHELKRLSYKDDAVFVRESDQKTGDLFKRNYYEPVFLARRVLSPTSPRNSSDLYYQPLIYELTNRNLSNRPEKKVNLILYDGAGEDYIHPERVVEFARYVLYASAIVFLVDPLRMPKVVNQLPSFLQGREQWEKRDVYTIIQSIIHLFENYHGLEAENRLKLIPIAITISKSDLLGYLSHRTAQPYSFLTQTTYKDGLKLSEIKVLDKEVRNFINTYEDYPLVQLAQIFPKVGFFAVSSTGYSSNTNGEFPTIQPVRCLDPVLWILSMLGIIDIDRR